MKTKGDWEGIPGAWLDDPQSPDGKRWIATHYGWEKVQARVKEEAKFRCELTSSENCAGATYWLDTHHRRGRGGGKRDDRVWVAGKRNLLAVCRPCHDLARIEKKEEIYDTPTADQGQPDQSRLPRRLRRTAQEVPGS